MMYPGSAFLRGNSQVFAATKASICRLTPTCLAKTVEVYRAAVASELVAGSGAWISMVIGNEVIPSIFAFR